MQLGLSEFSARCQSHLMRRYWASSCCGVALLAANYRAACRARSKAEFIAKIGLVLEEADESVFWVELLSETGTMKAERLEGLLGEARELTAIFTASQRTARNGK